MGVYDMPMDTTEEAYIIAYDGLARSNPLVQRHMHYIDLTGFGAVRIYINCLVRTQGAQDDPAAHILADIVAERLRR